MKSLIDFINERKESKYSVNDLYEAYKDGKYADCYKIMEDIFKNSPKKQYKEIRSNTDTYNAFITYNDIGGDIEMYMCAMLDDDNCFVQITCDNQHDNNGKINVAKNGSQTAYYKTSQKCVIIEFSQEMLDLMNKNYK